MVLSSPTAPQAGGHLGIPCPQTINQQPSQVPHDEVSGTVSRRAEMRSAEVTVSAGTERHAEGAADPGGGHQAWGESSPGNRICDAFELLGK